MLGCLTQLEFPQESPFESQYSALLAYYRKTQGRIDDAVRWFGWTREWPEMTELEKFFLAGRLDFACEVLESGVSAPETPVFAELPSGDGVTTADLLEWLLIKMWPTGAKKFLQNCRLQMRSRPKTDITVLIRKPPALII